MIDKLIYYLCKAIGYKFQIPFSLWEKIYSNPAINNIFFTSLNFMKPLAREYCSYVDATRFLLADYFISIVRN